MTLQRMRCSTFIVPSKKQLQTHLEKENVTVLKHYPTPLWFLWKSEADIVAKECVLSLDGILSMGISSRIVSRLGEGATTKLAAFVEVSEMMTEEVDITLTNVHR